MTKLVLLPGMDGTGDLFDSFVSVLDNAVTPVVIRYPTNQALGYEELVRYVWDRLPTDEDYYLLGESFSGPVAVSIAAEKPEGLRGLVLCASFLSNPVPGARALAKLASALPLPAIPVRLLAIPLFGRFSTPQWRIQLANAITQVAPDVLRARMRAVLGIDVTDAARQINVRTLYLQGTDDNVVPASAAHQAQKLIPGLQIERLVATHMLLQVAAIDAALLVQKFIAEADRCVS